jgi:uncharacterized protein with gpF-like domain
MFIKKTKKKTISKSKKDKKKEIGERNNVLSKMFF